MGDRRTPSHVDIDLRVRGWVVAWVSDAALIDEVIGGRADPGIPAARSIPLHAITAPEMPRIGNAEALADHRTRTRIQPLVGPRLNPHSVGQRAEARAPE
jgi:hypothetical protein